MKITRTVGYFVSAIALLASSSPVWVAGAEIDAGQITHYDESGFLQPVPVSISGFTGEVDSVLKHDLLFMGIKNVLPTEAKYLITGSNAGRVEGRVIQKSTKEQLLAKAYTGSSQRSQTHALADDIA